MPLPEPMLTYHQWGSVALSQDQFHGVLKISISKMGLKNTFVKLLPHLPGVSELTHWGRVMHICIGKLTIIDSDNGLLPRWPQAIIWINARILLTEPLGTNFCEMSIEVQTFSLKKICLKLSSAKLLSISSRPQCVTHLWDVPLGGISTTLMSS